MKVLVTGYGGLLGTHLRALLLAQNCAADFRGDVPPYKIVTAGRDEFNNVAKLAVLLQGVEAVFHFAGVNRGTDDEVANGNQQIASVLAQAIGQSRSTPHIVYANSTHSRSDSAYGNGKREAGEILSNASSGAYTNLILPHIFGEGGKPFYNSVTSTLCYQIARGEEPQLNPDGQVELLHAGVVADVALKSVLDGVVGEQRLAGESIAVGDLYSRLVQFHADYIDGLIPDITSDFSVRLFNTFRSYLYPDHYPVSHKLNSDNRGWLYEVVKGGAGQTFLSWTKPYVTRGDHFHLSKVERFSVVAGDAIIRIRHLFSDEVQVFKVNGENPVYIDMPTMHTHSIENVGATKLLTLFWANQIFDPHNSDTYALKVIDQK